MQLNTLTPAPERFQGYPLVARNGLLVASRAKLDVQPGLTVSDDRTNDSIKLTLAMPICRYVGDTTAQSFAVGVFTQVGYPVADFDYSKSQGYGVIVANPFSFTCQRPGFYHFNVHLLMDTETYAAGDIFQLNLYKNGVNDRSIARYTNTAAVAQYVKLQGTTTMRLARNDAVTVHAFTSNANVIYNAATAYEHVYIEMNFCGVSPESV